MRLIFTTLRCSVLVLLAVSAANRTMSQENLQKLSLASSFCTRENAPTIGQEQSGLTKTFDDDVRRITILLRAADLIWPYQQVKARGAFSEAFEIATRNFKEQGDKTLREGRLPVQLPDQRYTVITAIAKRDSEWSRKLSKQVLDDDEKEASDKANKDSGQAARTAEKLLNTALSLAATDEGAALTFARSSLAYSATLYLPLFLYKLAEIDRGAADQFYREAIIAYSRAPMDQFLYLSAYPFGRNREVGEMPAYSFYRVPAGFVANPSLQRLFVQTLLNRARELVQNPGTSQSGYRFSDAAQIWMALTRLEPLVAESFPDLSGPLQELRGNVFAMLPQTDQQKVNERVTDPPKRSFDESIEAADKIADTDRREGTIAIAILNAADSESLDKIEAAAAKIDDLKLRSQLLSVVYFDRAQRVLKEAKIEEARRLAAKVDELDQRAFLYSQIATESIKQTKNDSEARELLESVLDAITKAANTEIKVRALLAIAHLYQTIDANRALGVLGEAVKTINRLESPNLSGDHVNKRIEGKAFGYYRTIQTPGFSPETTFREVGKVDFDGVLYLASSFTDKSLRSLTTLALVEQCLKNQPAQLKSSETKTPVTKP